MIDMNTHTMNNAHLAMIGSHSALDVCRGAKEEGLKTIVLCELGREKTYTKYYKGIVDEAVMLKKFSDVAGKDIIQLLKTKNAIFVPNRSFEAYMGFDYGRIEAMDVPFFGSRKLLHIEERSSEKNQYYLMEKAGIRFPQRLEPEEIDRLVIAKASEAERGFQREFFLATSADDFERKREELLKLGKIKSTDFVIEEFIVGTPVNFNFFYSPLNQELELMGTDFRRQTNIDGLLRLPAEQQINAAEYITPSFKEAGHVAATVLESMLEKAFDAGERFVEACKEFGGIIGPFALQSIIVPGPPKEDIIVYDISPRVPGSPGTMFTPYTHYKYGKSISVGRRIAMEVRQAIEAGELDKILS